MTDRNKYDMGYRDGRSTSSRDALSAIAMRFIDEYFSLFVARTIFRHVYFCHEGTKMTSETSENTIFVRFYFTLLSNANRERNEAGYPERVGNRNCLTSVCGL